MAAAKVEYSEKIKCPCCEHEFDANDTAEFTDYWGGDHPLTNCEKCGVQLKITEYVQRRWSIEATPITAAE